MPISIGEVQSEVLVDPPEQQAGPAARGHGLPAHEEMERWRQLARRHEWDEARTRARDFDD